MYKCRYFQCPYVHRFVYELFISSVYLFVYPCVITVLIVLAPPPFADDVAFIPLSVLSLFLSFFVYCNFRIICLIVSKFYLSAWDFQICGLVSFISSRKSSSIFKISPTVFTLNSSQALIKHRLEFLIISFFCLFISFWFLGLIFIRGTLPFLRRW